MKASRLYGLHTKDTEVVSLSLSSAFYVRGERTILDYRHPDFVFGAGRVMVPKAAATFAPCDEIALIVAGLEGTSIEIYSTPLTADGSFAYGILRQTISQDRAQQQPAYAAVATLAAGTVAVLHAGGVLGPIWFGHWVDVPVAIPTSALTNGNETAVLILPQNGAPLGAAKYRLEFSLDRDRWSAFL